MIELTEENITTEGCFSVVFTLSVERVVRHSCDISTIYFNRPLTSYPGQFIMLNLPGYEEIPLSLSSPRSVTVRSVGETTEALIAIEAGNIVGIRGPFGRPFSLAKKAILIGGGMGIAPLRYLYLFLKRMGNEVRVIQGAKKAEDILWNDEFENAVYTTEDGSYGIKGDIMTAIEKENLEEYDRIYCCGKRDMMKRVYEILDEQGLLKKAEFSLEEFMRCGIGICGSCVIENGLRVCTDGPVFRGDELEW